MSYSGNKFDPKSGMIEGDHLAHLAGIGIHKLVERVEKTTSGYDRKLSADDLPAKVKTAVEQATKLSEQLLKCESLPVEMSVSYVKAQSKIAGEILPLIQNELAKREQAALDAMAEMRKNLTGKGGDFVAAAAESVLRAADAESVISREAGLAGWRSAFGIVRDNSTGKTIPRWLAELIRQHAVQTAANG